MSQPSNTSPASELDFVISRVINAPPIIVFQAWTNPQQMSQWWGPKIFQTDECILDVRVGGEYRITMVGADGTRYPAKGKYLEISKPERLVMTMDCSEHPPAWHDAINPNRKPGTDAVGEMVQTVTFEAQGNQTLLTIRTRFLSSEIRNGMLKLGMNEGWGLSLDRLQELLANTADREIVITRLLSATPEVAYNAWSNHEHLSKWFGPNGFSITTYSLDFKTNGVWRFVMHGPDGRDYQNRITYLELVPGERIVYVHGGSDDLEPTDHHTIVTFERQGSNTLLTMRGIFSSAEERARIIREYQADEGGKQTLSRLAEYLAMQVTSMKVQPYLYFEGRCEEAFEFYRNELGAELLFMMRYQESPDSPPPGMVPPGSENKIMHMSFRLGESLIMASDGLCSGQTTFKGITLSLSVPNDNEAERLFAALSQGGQVQMPLMKTFFSSRFGMVHDRFGVSWMVMVTSEAKPAEADTWEGDFVITRVLDAPRETVFKAWTEADSLSQWWGPKGLNLRVVKLDVRGGGIFHYAMQAPDGTEMFGKFVYREITKPEKIVFVNSFADAEGNIIRAPIKADWPLEVQNTLTLSEENGKTTLTLRARPINATPEEMQVFAGFHDSLRQGFGGTFEKLVAFLAKG